MNKFKFRFGDKVKYEGRQAIFVSSSHHYCHILLRGYMMTNFVSKDELSLIYNGTFTIRKARGGFRYNVQSTNGEVVVTSEVLKSKQSALDMQAKHFRQYRLIDKTNEK